jgi:hypothetical protein
MIDWQTSVVSEREAYAEYLLDFLDQKNNASRLSFTHQLIYLAQGKRPSITNDLCLVVQVDIVQEKINCRLTLYDG